MEMTIIEYAIVPLGWVIGNIVFNAFEKHLPLSRRLLKFVVTVGVLYAAGFFLGKYVLYTLLALMVMGMTILHGWWFPKQGVNGLTAEPYERYLEVIKKMKGK